MAAVRGAAAASAATAGDIILITYIIYSFVWPSHIIVRNIRQIISPARSWVAGALGRLTQFARNVFVCFRWRQKYPCPHTHGYGKTFTPAKENYSQIKCLARAAVFSWELVVKDGVFLSRLLCRGNCFSIRFAVIHQYYCFHTNIEQKSK